MAVQLNSGTTLESVYEPVLKEMHDALRGLRDHSTSCSDLRLLRKHLERLPLATDEYGLAQQRLENAREYLKRGEHGATTWELRTVVGQVCNAFQQRTFEPIRFRARRQ